MADDDRDPVPREATESRRKKKPAAEPVEEADERDVQPGEEKADWSRLYRLGRRLLDRGEDVRELASAVIETSDRAKTEMVRMVAREVRNYLDELRLKEDIMDLARSHSLEFKISVHLKPLAKDGEELAEPASRPADEVKRGTE